ncbi:MAG: DUF2652 domain-containing protein [Cyclobacteriaceae bacterium]
MAQQEYFNTEPTLIFMPDISGFSKFVNDTDLAHSQHIISELLEILIDSNKIYLKVSEIEGDAVLFYRQGSRETIDNLMAQVETMYLQFHSYLKKYEHTRICQCGACTTANNLKLKFVITYGEVGLNKIKGHTKLFGREVIVAHRLLKNDIDHDEYLLISDEALGKQKTAVESFRPTSQEYDIGKVDAKYLPLEFLADQVPMPNIEAYGLKEPKSLVMESSFVLDAPIDMVFNVLSDYEIRHEWTEGLHGSDELNGKISRNGSTHRCIVNSNGSDPFFIAHDFEIQDGKIVFSETDGEKGISIVYTLKELNQDKTELLIYTYLKAGFLKRSLFKLFIKSKILRDNQKSLNNLNNYCQNLLKTDKLPNVQIVLTRKVQEPVSE